jgi:CRP-like cAMP-binding protein
MALNTEIAFLSKVPLFEGFSEEMLRLLAFGSERRSVSKDRYLFHEGTAADCAFVVMDGRLELTRKDRRGKSIVIGTAIRGDLLGELAIISQTDRRMTAMALEDSDVMRINRPMFKRMMEEYPEVAILLRKRISRNISEMLRGIETLAPNFE